MKYLKFQTVVVALAMILSACGAEATPAVNPIDVQNTAVAAAFTMVAETQAAIPTATPLPPTETPSPTPMPTDTEIPSSDARLVILSNAGANSGFQQ